MRADVAGHFGTLLSYLKIEHPAGCPNFHAGQWNHDLNQILIGLCRTAQLANDWETVAYIYYQKGFYHFDHLDWGPALDSFLLCEKHAELAQNQWLYCLAVLAQVHVEIERKEYFNASLLLKTTNACLNQLRHKLPEYGFDNRHNDFYLFLQDADTLCKNTTKKLNNILKQQTQRIYQPSASQNQRPIVLPAPWPVRHPLTPYPPFQLSNHLDLYTVIHAVDGQQILSNIQDGDWLIIQKEGAVSSDRPVYVVDSPNGNLPGITIQVGKIQLGSRKIIIRGWLIHGDHNYGNTYRLNNHLTIPGIRLRQHGTVVGVYHHLEPYKLPKSSTTIKMVVQRTGKWFAQVKRSNTPPPLIFRQCESPSPQEFACLLPNHIYCVNNRLQTDFIPEIRPEDILIVELDITKPIVPGSPIIVEGSFKGDIQVHPHPNTPRQFYVALYKGQPQSGVIEFFVNNGEARKTSLRMTFKGVIVGYYRRLK